MLGILTVEEIEKVLADNVNGRIGYIDNDRVYVIPVSYAYNGTDLILHSHEGSKINAMRKSPHVCFEVDEIKDQANWRSVLAWGNYEEVTDNRERYYAMKYLVGRLLHVKVSETMPLGEHTNDATPDPHEKRPVVYRIRIREKSGRYERTIA